MDNCCFCKSARLPNVARCPNCNKYQPTCVKCGKDISSVEEMTSIEEDSNVGKVSFYIHKNCLAKAKGK